MTCPAADRTPRPDPEDGPADVRRAALSMMAQALHILDSVGPPQAAATLSLAIDLAGGAPTAPTG